jgi:holo-[acyl-carrier protein] synthase
LKFCIFFHNIKSVYHGKMPRGTVFRDTYASTGQGNHLAMIAGIGIDIIEIDRMEKALRRHGDQFAEKIFTEEEQKYCNRSGRDRIRAQCYAGRFAAKEAFVKALGTGLRGGLGWTDIEVVNDPLGKPVLVLHGGAESESARRNLSCLHLTISHSRTAAAAVVVMET